MTNPFLSSVIASICASRPSGMFRLMRRQPVRVTVEQHNPPGQRDFPEERIEAMRRVLTNNELYV